MFIYAVLTVPVAILAGLLIALLTKKADHVTYNSMDKVGRITNIILLPLYISVIPATLFLGMVSVPNYSGVLGVLGWIVAMLISSATLFSGLGLGFSVALRKKGKSAASFTVQFAGLAGMLLSAVLYAATVGNLIQTLN